MESLSTHKTSVPIAVGKPTDVYYLKPGAKENPGCIANLKVGIMTLVKVAIAALVLSFGLSANPINVSYTVTGSTGNWTLDFSVNNNLAGAANQDFYFFGVQLSGTDITGTPSPFVTYIPFNPSTSWGGANIIYNNVWLADSSGTDGLPGTTTSGFDVKITDAVAPTSVDWFAFTYGSDPYSGAGNLNAIQENGANNPLFEGSATPTQTSTTPEPSTLLLLGAGLASISALRRSKKA
jgi:hypothetical protein